jgi:hypothetical protein
MQGEQGMELDSGLGLLKGCPGKQSQTKVDGGGIQGVGGLSKRGDECIVGIQAASLRDKHLSEVGVDSPVALFVGMSQVVARNFATESGVIQLRIQNAETDFDVPQTLAVGELCEGHAQELIQAREGLDFEIASMTSNALPELGVGEAVHQLGQDSAAKVHAPSSGEPRLAMNFQIDFRRKGRNSMNAVGLSTSPEKRWDSSGTDSFFAAGSR